MPTLSKLLSEAYRYDLIVRYNKFGNQHIIKAFPQKYIVSLISACDEISSKVEISGHETRQIITALGLLWDNCSQEYPGLQSSVMVIMSRLGYLANTELFQQKHSQLSILDSFNIQSNRLLSSNLTKIDGRIYFTALQQRVWESLNQHPRVAISAPTSAGKTFVITKWISNALIDVGGICLFIAPTLSLCAQIAQQFFESSNSKFNVRTTLSENLEPNCVYVLTQEKVAGYPDVIKAANYIVIDEIHNIEKFAEENPDRSLVLLDVIEDIVSNSNANKMIVAGPMISGIKELSELLFENEFQVIEDTISPVVSLTYSFTNSSGFSIQSHNLDNSKISISLHAKAERGIESSRFASTAKAFMNRILETIPESDGVIIFSGSTSQSSTIAKSIIGTPSITNDLCDYCSDTVSPSYDLTLCLKRGIAYHHSRIPTHIRRCIEIAFSRGDIRRVIATTTLLQGVNFPAKHIIIRNPKLGSKVDSPRLSDYDLSNLRGRAGRLFKDFVGRAYLLNEEQFQEDGELELFPQKEVQSSLKERFDKNAKMIIENLINIDDGPLADASLQALIASKIALQGDSGVKSLEKLGISLSSSQVAKIKLSIAQLNLDKEFHSKFTRIDPVSLSKIQNLVAEGFEVPDITKADFYKKLVSFINRTNEVVPDFFARKLKIDPNHAESFVTLASQWGSGSELRSIIASSAKYYRDIGELINVIQSKITYDLTGYLSPFMHLQRRKNITIEALDAGSWNSQDLEKISKGIPREVAVRLRLKKANTKWDKILIEHSH